MGLRKNRCNNQKGQAVTEYILVLVVTVAIIVGAVRQFNVAFKEYLDNYFGNYLDCLISVGELPSLGSSDPNSAGLCNSQFQPFTFTAGRPPNNPGPDGGGGGGSGGSAGSDRTLKKGGQGSAGSSESGGSASSRGKARSGRGGGGASTNRFAARRSKGGGGKVGRFARGTGKNGNNKAEIGNVDGRPERQLARNRGGYSGQLGRGRESEDENPQSFKSSSSTDDKGKAGEKILVKRKPAQTGLLEDDEPLTFGDYIRYLIIFAIIIALLLFIGGQALQLSKELD